MDQVAKYWNNKFKDKGYVWGKEPSGSAVSALAIARQRGLSNQRVLDLACGYGRDSFYFAANGLLVTGMDISLEAIEMAQSSGAEIEFMVGDMLNLPFSDRSFGMLFSNFSIHLFDGRVRQQIIEECYRVLSGGGIAVFSVASVDDPDFGQGEQIGENCFMNSRGVVKYYYSRAAIDREFGMFHEVAIEDIEEHHEHDGPHCHKSFLIAAVKPDDQAGVRPNV